MALLRVLVAGALVVSAAAAPAHAGVAGGPAAGSTHVVVAAGAAAGSTSLRERVEQLQADVDRAGAELAAGATRVERAEARLAVLTQRQVDAAVDLDEATAVASRAQADVDALARAAYKGGVLPPTLTAVLTGDPRALADLARVRTAVDSTSAARQEEVSALAAQRDRGAGALVETERLRREALVLRERLEQDVADVGTRAAELSAALTRTSAALQAALAAEAEQARAAAARAAAAREAASSRLAAERAAAGGAGGTGAVALPAFPAGAAEPAGACAPAAPHGYANGFLPPAVLCPGPDGALLRTDAARALTALAAAYEQALGASLCVTDSYRDYAGQVDVFRRKPALAAVPGRSQHGWGLAVDLCGGVQQFGTPAHRWLRAHAPTFGWDHPAWARADGSRPEAWHWEYAAGP